MSHHLTRSLLAGSLAAGLLGACASTSASTESTTASTTTAVAPPPTAGPPVPAATGNLTGSLPDGATWTMDVPPEWNGTLLLFSHGLVPPGEPNPALDAPDPVTAQHLVQQGYALAGSSYAGSGWVPEAALADQVAVLDVFADTVGTPLRTVAWGQSLGGMLSAELVEQLPDRVDGALPMCGLLAGSVGTWDTYLDTMFVLTTLVAPDLGIDVVDVSDPFAAIDALGARILEAQQTPEGRARIALAASVGNVPGRAGGGSPAPDPADVDGREQAQLENLQTVVLFGLALRSEMEAHVDGNPSTNVDIDYRELLERSSAYDEVKALYAAAGSSLEEDLTTLAQAPRIAADPAAREVLARSATFDGELAGRPVLTLHTSDDPLVGAQNESAYRDAVAASGDGALLRQAFTDRAGHCLFTPAEMVASLDTLVERMDTGDWPGTSAAELEARARSLGTELNVHFEDGDSTPLPTEPAFTDDRPGPYLRAAVDAL
jgi:dienelactone hydrolase